MPSTSTDRVGLEGLKTSEHMLKLGDEASKEAFAALYGENGQVGAVTENILNLIDTAKAACHPDYPMLRATARNVLDDFYMLCLNESERLGSTNPMLHFLKGKFYLNQVLDGGNPRIFFEQACMCFVQAIHGKLTFRTIPWYIVLCDVVNACMYF